jgi:folate-binding protein YgfZ
MFAISTLKVTGPDAAKFLQGQLTNDIRRLDREPEVLAAWCNPKGRVIWFGTISPIESGFGLSVPAEMAEDVARRLTLFRFRSKVDFELVDEGQTVEPAFLVETGHAYIGPAQAEQFTPHMLNLDLLDAINFDKGCYTGQEIVARTHYKGATKRRTLRFRSASPVSVGGKVQLDGRDVGEVLNVAGAELLAVVPLDKADAALTVDDVPLTRLELPYL